ncbi:hypothetical protein ACGFSG_25680 [Streptomyces sp. NPDC048512]|uniref:hypothetical protein n=1 Tax=unclassified Streptomyces TaxID=2593676 RepID=UPI00117EDEC4|nr:hypothetical protein [Streptomyces sp. M41(2017)]
MAHATDTFQDAVARTVKDPCPKAAGTCWDEMTSVMGPARSLRKAMRAYTGASLVFWSPAFDLMDTMESGYAEGEDKGANAFDSNRQAVLGSARYLSKWLDEHPVN